MPINTFDTTVRNIPVTVEIIRSDPGRPAYISGPPEYCYPAEPAEVEWEFSQNYGGHYHKADWLFNYLTDEELDQVQNECLDYLVQMAEDSKLERYLDELDYND